MNPNCIDHLAQQVIIEQTRSKSFIVPDGTMKPGSFQAVEGPSPLNKLYVLLKRMLLQRWRNKATLGYQILHHSFSGLCCGFTFFQAGLEANLFLQNIKFCLALCVFYVYTYLMVSILYCELVEVFQQMFVYNCIGFQFLWKLRW